jgi:hypothetical protein
MVANWQNPAQTGFLLFRSSGKEINKGMNHMLSIIKRVNQDRKFKVFILAPTEVGGDHQAE